MKKKHNYHKDSSGLELSLKSALIETTLGAMIAVADESYLYWLGFIESTKEKHEIARLNKKLHAVISPGTTPILENVEKEIKNYFAGKNTVFKTPLYFIGTDFQKSVWNTLKTIPFGKTKSYLDIAQTIKKPKAYRAVAQANGANKFTIIIPCHRVINESGALGGYSSGMSRKIWLLEHEGQLEG